MTDFPALSIAILENLVRPILGDSVISLLREGLGIKDLDILLYEALNVAEERFIKEYQDVEICSGLKQLPCAGISTVQTAAKEFYNRPTDVIFSGVLEREFANIFGHSISAERISKAAKVYSGIFQEELAVSSPQMREKLNTLAMLRNSKNSSHPKIEGDLIMGNKIVISNSTIGILNSGEMKNIENISVNITNLETSKKNEIAKAIKEITEVVTNSLDVSQNQRNEILEQIQELSRQAVLPPEKRSATGVIKAVFLSLGSTIGTIAGIAQIWSTWGGVISKFFGF